MQRRGIITQRPTEKFRLQAGRVLGRGSNQMRPVALVGWVTEETAKEGLEDRVAGSGLRAEQNSA